MQATHSFSKSAILNLLDQKIVILEGGRGGGRKQYWWFLAKGRSCSRKLSNLSPPALLQLLFSLFYFSHYICISVLPISKGFSIDYLQVSYLYKKTRKDMTNYMKKVLENKVRVLLYFGDTDMVCNFMMGQQFIERLKLPVSVASSISFFSSLSWR